MKYDVFISYRRSGGELNFIMGLRSAMTHLNRAPDRSSSFWPAAEPRAGRKTIWKTKDRSYADVCGEDREQAAGMYPWFRREEEKIVRLRKKCLELAEYTYDGRDGQGLHSLMFYNEFLLFMLMLWCYRGNTRRQGTEGEGVFRDVMSYIAGMDIHEVLKAYSQAERNFAEYFRKYMIRPLEKWPVVLRSGSGEMTEEERSEYTAYAIRFFEAVLDMSQLFFECWPEPDFEKFVNHKLLCHYRYLKRRRIFLPRDLQKKVFEMSMKQ